jgi:membrane protease YdiL (CAAX protease family)
VTTLDEPPAAAPPLPERAEASATRGWYRDPAGCHEFRYWDGLRWTPGVADNGFVREVPLPDEPCAPADERARPPARAAAIAIAAMVLGFLAAGGVVLGLDAWTSAGQAWRLGASSAALWSFLLGAVVLVSRRYGSGSVRQDFGVHVRWVDLGWGLLLAVVARMVAGVVVVVVLLASGRLENGGVAEQGAADLETATLVVAALVLVIGAPLVEELFFRGLLQRSLQTRLPVWGAVLTQAVLFSAAHVFASVGVLLIAQLIAVFLFGLAAGAVVQHFRRLGTTMVAHALFNAVVVVTLLVVAT